MIRRIVLKKAKKYFQDEKIKSISWTLKNLYLNQIKDQRNVFKSQRLKKKMNDNNNLAQSTGSVEYTDCIPAEGKTPSLRMTKIRH